MMKDELLLLCTVILATMEGAEEEDEQVIMAPAHTVSTPVVMTRDCPYKMLNKPKFLLIILEIVLGITNKLFDCLKRSKKKKKKMS